MFAATTTELLRAPQTRIEELEPCEFREEACQALANIAQTGELHGFWRDVETAVSELVGDILGVRLQTLCDNRNAPVHQHNTDKLFTPDCFNGQFIENNCVVCGRA